MAEIRRKKGTYFLIFKAVRQLQCQVGKLGKLRGAIGYYGYVGSAQGPGGVAARVHHHLKIATKPRWHLDYVRPYLLPVEVWCNYDTVSVEHQWAQSLLCTSRVSPPLAGFGASDCRCKSHLMYFEKAPSIYWFKDLLQRQGSAAGSNNRNIVIERTAFVSISQ